MCRITDYTMFCDNNNLHSFLLLILIRVSNGRRDLFLFQKLTADLMIEYQVESVSLPFIILSFPPFLPFTF